MDQISLLDFNQFVRRVLALNFGEAIWIEAELAQVQQSRGHFYLSLVQKDSDSGQLLAQAEARLWAAQLSALRRERGPKITDLLRPGIQLRLRVQAVFHERYGYSLNVKDVDPDFTEGRLEQSRRQTIQQLQLSGDIDRNREHQLNIVPQRVAVISAESAAGWADFNQQIAQNESGYSFRLQLFTAAMQGENAAVEIAKRLREVGRRQSDFDAVVIIRGGGSKLDLLAFDDLELCRQVALCPLPVISGIGHEIDESILDLVSHTALKTPTAVAAFLLDRAAQLEGLLWQQQQRIQGIAQQKVAAQLQRLTQIADRVPLAVRHQLQRASMLIDKQEKVLELLDPATVLARGYALVSHEGQAITQASEAPAKGAIDIRWQDGQRQAELQEKKSKERVGN
ncbi:MAG: exodeoxyribonuclease VII large subunit [Bacteroidota bacterium]